jgi:ribosome biogenesis SPOUT family RNA methylase Rps3
MAIVVGSCMIMGGILGDRLRKKRNYRPYYL